MCKQSFKKPGEYTVNKDNIIPFEDPSKVVNDHLTNFIREQAKTILQAAIEAEAQELINKYKDQKTDDNKQRLVKNGYLPERNIKTGIGDMPVKVPRVRDRADSDEPIVFESNLIPKYMRRTVTIDLMLPILYLKGISTNDFQDALAPMLGENAKSISPGVISSLKKAWYSEFQEWKKLDLSKKRYVYLWADGVYLQARMESEKSCMLVIIGADEFGNKELVAMTDGFRESKESWKSLLLDLKSRGLNYSPHLAVGDGALGFWGALNEVYPTTKHQRCWVHKTVNVLDKLPKNQQATAKSMLQEIYSSATKNDAEIAFDKFISKYEEKYLKVAECLLKDRDALLNFYDFPARHWQHIKTTNPIESTFATVKHRTRKSRGCFSRETIVASTFKLLQEAQKRWKKLYGHKQLADVVNLIKFKDGVDERILNKESDIKDAA